MDDSYDVVEEKWFEIGWWTKEDPFRWTDDSKTSLKKFLKDAEENISSEQKHIDYEFSAPDTQEPTDE